MIERLTDFRKTALITGIAIAVSVLSSFFRQLLIFPHRSTSDLVVSIVFSLVFLLLALPLPVFLVLLYRTGITPALSRNLRFVAAALAAIRGAAFLFGIRDAWRAGIPPDVGHVASRAGGHLSAATFVISDAASFGSELAFVFFLVALARQHGPSQNAGKRASRQVQNAALIAIFARALSIIILLLGFQVYAYAVRTYGSAGMAAPSVLSDLRRLLFALPGLIAPLIVLIGVIRSRRQC